VRSGETASTCIPTWLKENQQTSFIKGACTRSLIYLSGNTQPEHSEIPEIIVKHQPCQLKHVKSYVKSKFPEIRNQ
jgi:hypothetical protein